MISVVSAGSSDQRSVADGLTLDPQYVDESARSHGEEPTAGQSLSLQSPAKPLFDENAFFPADVRRTSAYGVDTLPVMGNTAVEYRLDAGTGLGVATNAAWCVSQSVSLGRDFGLVVYYLRGMGSLGADAAKSMGAEAQDIGRSVGFRLDWEF